MSFSWRTRRLRKLFNDIYKAAKYIPESRHNRNPRD